MKKGLPFRDAYKITGGLVAYCIGQGKTLEELSPEEFHNASPLFEKDVYQAIDLASCVQGRSGYGGPAESSVRTQLESLDAFIAKISE